MTMTRKMLLTSNGFTTIKIREALMQLIGQSPNQLSVVLIPTAHGRLKSQAPVSIKAKQDLDSMGFKNVSFLDIEFENAQKLNDYDMLCLSGGNPFYLLHHLKSSGADQVIVELAKRGIVLTGISAGTVVLGKDICIVDYFTPEFNHLGLTDLRAIGLYDQTIFPHYGSPTKFQHEKSHAVRIQEFEARYDRKVERLTDHEAIYVNGLVVKRIT